jgi:hypothetical protein
MTVGIRPEGAVCDATDGEPLAAHEQELAAHRWALRGCAPAVLIYVHDKFYGPATA